MRQTLYPTLISWQKIVLFGMLAALLLGGTSMAATHENTYTNPIARSGADPWVIRHEGMYYYCYSKSGMVGVKKAARLQDIDREKDRFVWFPTPGKEYSEEVWAPELHYLEEKWYIYVATDDGDNHNHRMYVLESQSQDPQDRAYELKGQITDPSDKWAIDGTVLLMDSGAMYFIWSGWKGDVNVQQNLYIAPMSNPWTINGERVLISQPEHAWEKIGNPLINEGPQVLQHNGRVFIIYSASGSWTDSYCLGQLALVGDNPLDPTAWVKKDTPVFSPTDTVFGPGHASFVVSPDGTEHWIVYHAAKFKGSGWSRNVRMQRFEWTADGEPNLGVPVETGVEFSGPSQ